MVERKMFEKIELVEVLDKMSNHLNTPMKGYLIGGLAMIFHGNKISTKDIDIIFESVEKANSFESVIGNLGFERILDLSVNYIKYALSLEDIFLFKGITDRPDDLADMASIASAGLDWKIIENELKDQREYWRFLPRYYLRLGELELEYGITSPSRKELEKEAELTVGIGLLITQLEKGPISLENAIEFLGEKDHKFPLKVLNKMKELKIINELDGTFRLVTEFYP